MDIIGAQAVDVVLRRGNKVSLEIEFSSAYEAAIMYQDIQDAAEKGAFSVSFNIETRLGSVAPVITQSAAEEISASILRRVLGRFWNGK